MNGVIGANDTHSATIVDDDNPPMVSFFVPNQVVSEEIGVFTTSLTLSEISGKDIYIPYTLSGTTIPEDYLIHEPSPLYLPAGSSTADINMDILEGDGWEVDETLIITLGQPVNALLGSPAAQTIVITESSEEPSVIIRKQQPEHDRRRSWSRCGYTIEQCLELIRLLSHSLFPELLYLEVE